MPVCPPCMVHTLHGAPSAGRVLYLEHITPAFLPCPNPELSSHQFPPIHIKTPLRFGYHALLPMLPTPTALLNTKQGKGIHPEEPHRLPAKLMTNTYIFLHLGLSSTPQFSLKRNFKKEAGFNRSHTSRIVSCSAARAGGADDAMPEPKAPGPLGAFSDAVKPPAGAAEEGGSTRMRLGAKSGRLARPWRSRGCDCITTSRAVDPCNQCACELAINRVWLPDLLVHKISKLQSSLGQHVPGKQVQ